MRNRAHSLQMAVLADYVTDVQVRCSAFSMMRGIASVFGMPAGARSASFYKGLRRRSGIPLLARLAQPHLNGAVLFGR